ncbi:MAG: hypothetical protein IPL26_30180 [Leptospiraceae bacterium]|nr:hypothetical protein [Leptospiraceae bacterium]
MNNTNKFYGLLIFTIFFLTLNEISSAKKNSVKSPTHGCYNTPIFVYDEERKKYYRQDWCKSGKQPVYFDAIPVPTERGERRLA